MTTNPVFSIITVTLNNLSGLRKTYDSILSQNFYDYEWLVVDGNSKDATLSFLKSTHAQYISEQDHGIYDAMNKGLDRATGDYIIFMNAGDCFAEKDILSTIKKHIEDKYSDFLYGDSFENFNNKVILKKSALHSKIKNGMFTHHQSMIYKKDVIGNQRFDLSYLIAADYDFTYRYLQKCKEISKLSLPLCVFESGGISQTHALQGRIEQFKIRKQLDENTFRNTSVFVAQTVLFTLRKICPVFYWRLKYSLTKI